MPWEGRTLSSRPLGKQDVHFVFHIVVSAFPFAKIASQKMGKCENLLSPCKFANSRILQQSKRTKKSFTRSIWTFAKGKNVIKFSTQMQILAGFYCFSLSDENQLYICAVGSSDFLRSLCFKLFWVALHILILIYNIIYLKHWTVSILLPLSSEKSSTAPNKSYKIIWLKKVARE